MSDKCTACNEVAVEGFALGRLCYHCIEETVVAFIQQQKTIRHNEFQGMEIKDYYCNGFFGRDFSLDGAVVVSNNDKYITIRKMNGEILQANIDEYDAKVVREYVVDWTTKDSSEE